MPKPASSAHIQRVRDALDKHERSTRIDDELWGAGEDGTELAFERLGRILALLDEQAQLGQSLRETLIDRIKTNSDDLSQMRKSILGDRFLQQNVGIPTRSWHKREYHRFHIRFFKGQLRRLDERLHVSDLHAPTVALLREVHRAKDYRRLQDQLVRPEVIDLLRQKLLDFKRNEPDLRPVPPPPAVPQPSLPRGLRWAQRFADVVQRFDDKWNPPKEWSEAESLTAANEYDGIALRVRGLFRRLSEQIDTSLDTGIDLVDSTPSSASLVRRTLNALMDDDRFVGLVGSPVERVDCLLAMRDADWLDLIKMTNQLLHTADPTRRVLSGDVTVESLGGIVHRGVAELDVEDALSELLSHVQSALLPAAGDNTEATARLHTVALMINATGLVVHGLNDGNGRTFRALSYLVRSGMQLPQSQIREFELTIQSGLPGRDYAGSDLGVVHGKLNNLAIQQLLAPFAEDFRNPSVPRKLNADRRPRLYHQVGNRTYWIRQPLDDLLFFEDGSDELLTGLGFATMYVFARRNGYLKKSTSNGPDGLPTLNQHEVLYLAYRDQKMSEFINFDRSVRRALPALLLRELTAPTARLSDEESLDSLLGFDEPMADCRTLIENLELNFQNSGFAQDRTTGRVGGREISGAETFTI